MSLAQYASRIFRHANRRYGEPYLTAVRPLADWSLPAGYAYDAHVDAIRNAAGYILTEPQAYWTTDTVYIVPTRSSAEDASAEAFALLAGGVAPGGFTEVWVRQSDITTLRAAHALLLDKRWYDIASLQEAPAGYPTTDGLWGRLRLRARA